MEKRKEDLYNPANAKDINQVIDDNLQFLMEND